MGEWGGPAGRAGFHKSSAGLLRANGPSDQPGCQRAGASLHSQCEQCVGVSVTGGQVPNHSFTHSPPPCFAWAGLCGINQRKRSCVIKLPFGDDMIVSFSLSRSAFKSCHSVVLTSRVLNLFFFVKDIICPLIFGIKTEKGPSKLSGIVKHLIHPMCKKMEKSEQKQGNKKGQINFHSITLLFSVCDCWRF